MLWSIDSCQNWLPADQCHDKTLSRAQVYRKIKVHTKFLLLALVKSIYYVLLSRLLPYSILQSIGLDGERTLKWIMVIFNMWCIDFVDSLINQQKKRL